MNIDSLDVFRDDGNAVNVIIETSKGSRNKIDYDPKLGVFELAGTLPEGSVFPYDFGFIPSTLGEDGDPLDVLVLMDESVPTGCLISARLIGAIEANQSEQNGDSNRNDRLIGVATRAHTHASVHRLEDLRPHMMDEIEHFFISYNQTKNKKFEPLRRRGPDGALAIVKEGLERKRGAE
jgi:inorganic pyrophosphatase